jgi:hypothetical protein
VAAPVDGANQSFLYEKLEIAESLIEEPVSPDMSVRHLLIQRQVEAAIDGNVGITARHNFVGERTAAAPKRGRRR